MSASADIVQGYVADGNIVLRPSLAERIRAVRRRMPAMLAAFASIVVLVAAIALLWPATYTAKGTILIEQQELPTDLVRSSISSFADQRLQMISQRVMTSDNLIKIIQRHDLYADLRKRKVREEVLERMREDIAFKMISADVIDPRSGHPTKATIAFTVSYSNRSAETASRVANELVSLYLQENVENRTKRAADATSFLSEEGDRLAVRIDELQSRLAQFKERNLNDLPELASVNIQLMTRAEEELRDVETHLRSLHQQAVYLDAQLAQLSPTAAVYMSTGERVLSPQDRLKFLRTEYARAAAIYAPTHPDVVRLQREITGLETSGTAADSARDLERQLEDANTQLAQARERYADDHPDIARLRRLAEALGAQLDVARAKPATQLDTSNADNPAYIQVKAQREATGGELASLEKKKVALQTRIAELERRLESAPSVEREYMALVRELDTTQLKYREVRQKQMEAQVSQNLEDGRKGERFTMIEPPYIPGKPSSPNRPLIFVLGVVLGIAGAVGLLLLLESLDGSVRSQRELAALVRVPPLAVVPWMKTPHERTAQRRKALYTAIGIAAGAAVFLTLAHWLYRPLDVLWRVLLRKLGWM